MTRVVFETEEIHLALEKMADDLAQRASDAPWAVVGIRRGGEHLANRLALMLRKRIEAEVPVGYVDITLYRDDGFGPHDWPQVGVTDIPFELRSHTVILVDDVLYTGRTVRAAIDAIIDYGRPLAIRLAVLVDRGLRELPIKADTAGFHIETSPTQHVGVHLVDQGAERDRVTISPKGLGNEDVK